VTTATTTRAAKKKTTKQTKAKTKKPKWDMVTFKQIEGWREKLGLSKSAMAEALQTTNSTYHNWQRGTTVPHPNQQEKILIRLQALETNASKGGDAPEQGTGPIPSKKGGKGSRGRQSGGRSGSSGGSGNAGPTGQSGRGSSKAPQVGKRTPASPTASPKVSRSDIAAITVAFIQAQKKAVSADTIFQFVEQLQDVL